MKNVYVDTLIKAPNKEHYEGEIYTFTRVGVRWAAFNKVNGAIVGRDQFRNDLADRLNVKLVNE